MRTATDRLTHWPSAKDEAITRQPFRRSRIAVITVVGLYVLLGGALSFCGWVFDIQALTDWDFDGISIQPNATICATASGLTLILLAANRRRTAAACAALVLLIGAATLLEWLTGVSFGHDDLLLFGREWGREGVVRPGRMGPPGSLSWTLIGAALLLTAVHPVRLSRFAPALALLTMAVSAVSIVGYLYGADPLYSVSTLTIIAFQTSTFLMAMSVGIIASNPDREPMRTLIDPSGAGFLARRIMPLLVVLAGGLGFLRVRMQNAGLVDTGMGTAMLVLSLTVLLAGALWWTFQALRLREQSENESLSRERTQTALMQAILDTSPTPIWVGLDSQCARIVANPAADRLLGLSHGANISLSTVESSRYTPGGSRGSVDVRPAMHLMQRAAREGVDVVVEEREVIAADGSRIWLMLHASPLCEAGVVRGAVAVALDITERKRAEEELRESEERFRLIVEGVDDIAIITLSTEGFISGWNVGAEKLLGWSEEEAIGQHGRLIFTPEDRERGIDRGEIETTLEAGKAENERWHLRKDGSRFWGSGLAMRMKDENGQVRGLVKIMRDRTAGRLTEQALQASEERFRGLGEALPLIVSLARPDGTIDYVSPYWHEFSGRSAENFISGDWYGAIHPDDREGVLAAWRTAIADGQPYEYEFRARDRDDEYRWLFARGVPVRDADGAISYWVHVAANIDSRKVAEESLREADRRKDEFLATLAHELRNPLAPIRNCLHILLRAGTDAASQGQLVQMMDRQVNHMLRLVDDLLEVSRITRGKIDLRQEVIDLAGVIRSAVESASPSIEAAGHQLTIGLPPTPVLITGDPVRLAQVIVNLLSNAAKYTEDGGQIWLTARREDDRAVISVRDNGTGIPVEMLPRVFYLFTQIDRTLGRAQGGLGIGLALVKSLVELHEGTVEARSDGPGKGSEFIVRLPVKSEKDSPSPNGITHSDLRCRGTVGRRVLVVDDNEDAAISLAMLLRTFGMETHTAHDGPSALEATEDFRPYAVFLDIGMPGMDGYEVAARIRSQPQYHDITLIALTGWGQEEDKKRAQQAGFDHHMVKPLEAAALETLLSSINEVAN